MNKKNLYIIIAASAFLLFITAAPRTFTLIDDNEFTGNYRIPYPMGENYYLFSHYSSSLSKTEKILFLGDSVIWGHYADTGNTLTAQLNRLHGNDRFANMGIDGIHPAALYGLVKKYSAHIENRDIIAGVNLLWMSSPRHDLSGEINNEINHKKLLPQFSRDIPAYGAGLEERISSFINTNFKIISWVNHIKMSSFADSSFYRWTIDNPRKNIRHFFKGRDMSYTVPPPMRQAGVALQNVTWVEPENSIQWQYMKKTINLLRERNNRVRAYITPYNLHSLTPESRERYIAIREILIRELEAEGISCITGKTPKQEYFADASHTGEEGYRILSEELLQDKKFNSLLR